GDLALTASGSAAAADDHEPELAGCDVSLELGEGRRRIGAREAAHGHDRQTGRQLDRAGLVRRRDGDDPPRGATVGDEVIGQRGADVLATGPAVGSAGRAAEPGSARRDAALAAPLEGAGATVRAAEAGGVCDLRPGRRVAAAI